MVPCISLVHATLVDSVSAKLGKCVTEQLHAVTFYYYSGDEAGAFDSFFFFCVMHVLIQEDFNHCWDGSSECVLFLLALHAEPNA